MAGPAGSPPTDTEGRLVQVLPCPRCVRPSRRAALGGVLLLLCLSGTSASPAEDAQGGGGKKKAEQLAVKYQQWLDDVELLITTAERAAFLDLEKDYQRDGFIYRFWEARNPYPGSSRNEFRQKWEARLEEARHEYGTLNDDRARMFMLHGPPQTVTKTDCGMLFWPLEIWQGYSGDNIHGSLLLLFWQRGAGGNYRLWRHEDGYQQLLSSRDVGAATTQTLQDFERTVRYYCRVEGETVLRAILEAQRQQRSHESDLIDAAPPPRDREWLNSFRIASTDLLPGAPTLTARLELKFPHPDHTLGRRTVVQGFVWVPLREAVAAQLGNQRAYNFLLNGEVLRGSELFESFRYRFDLPTASLDGDQLPLIFERVLPAGEYTLILRGEDLHSHREFRDERPLIVPEVEESAGSAASDPTARGATSGAAADAARAALAQASARLKILVPEGNLFSGPLRIEAEATGEAIRKVAFLLDGKEMLSRNRPPYSVELNLGDLPREHEVRAVAYDATGQAVASDTLALNPPKQRFAVRLLEPRPGSAHRDHVEVRAEVRLPDGASLDRLELYLGEERAATLYQPPYTQTVPLPRRGGASFVRAVAYLADGSAVEDLAVINAPDVAERMEVRLVELYSSVVDAAGRPVRDLQQSDFKVFELGKEQQLLRFEPVHDLPLHVLIAIDTSASMLRSLPQVQTAVFSFVEHIVKPKDQVALVTFNEVPHLRTPFTAEVRGVAGALAGLNAEGGTALWDSLVYALSYMKGATGQSALLLFTDGGDHLSHLRFEEALDFARRSGIVIYSVGVQVPLLDLPERNHLSKLASETGGRAFFIDSASELDAVAASIEEELRARYLLAYQSRNPPRPGEFRPVAVKVAGDGRQVKAIRGYYP
jgi:VWFA-related protein